MNIKKIAATTGKVLTIGSGLAATGFGIYKIVTGDVKLGACVTAGGVAVTGVGTGITIASAKKNKKEEPVEAEVVENPEDNPDGKKPEGEQK